MYVAYGPNTRESSLSTSLSPSLILFGYIVLRMIGTIAAAVAACAIARAHIETIVQHVGNAIHIQILIGS